MLYTKKRTKRSHHRLLPQLCLSLGLVFLCTFFLFTGTSSAFSTQALTGGPSIDTVDVGFNGKFQDQNWIPIRVTLHNDGSDFTGQIALKTASGSQNGSFNSPSTYQENINLPAGTHKKITLYLPLSLNSTGIRTLNVVLINANGQQVTSSSTQLNALSSNIISIGVLSDLKNGFGALSQAAPINSGITVNTEPLNADLIPTNPQSLNNFDLLVLDNFTTSSLSQDQLLTIQQWVNQGGSLVVAGGPEWHRTLSTLPANLLPVTITGTDTLAAQTHLLPIGGPGSQSSSQPTNDTLSDPINISIGSPVSGSSVLLSSGKVPLIAQSTFGQGTITYLAFDPAIAPLFGWQNTTTLWQTLLTRSLANRIFQNSTNNGNYTNVNSGLTASNMMDALVRSFVPNATPSPWLILLLLLGYVLILGPIRLFIVRRFKKRSWSWRIVLSTIVVFTGLSYGLALQQKGTSVISSRVSMIQLSRPDATGSLEHINTYFGVYVPSQGDFHVHLPTAGTIQTMNNNFYGPPPFSSSGNAPTTFTSSGTATDVTLQGLEIWSIRTLQAQNDRHVSGGIRSKLTLQDKTIKGTVSNTLPYAISDAYLLIGNDFVSLGHLNVGESKTVNLPLTNSLITNGQTQSLADQIANSLNIPNQYFNPYNPTTPSDDVHRHVELLQALNSSNANCFGGCPYGRGVVTNGLGKIIINSNANYGITQDPLLLSNAPATLIGWTDPAADPNNNLTINGIQPSGAQETFLQAPLDLQYGATASIPGSAIPGQVVDFQNDQSTGNTSIQSIGGGLYALSTGGLTFEYTLPTTAHIQSATLTLSSQANAANSAKSYQPGQAGTISDITHLQTSLYNWQSGKWDAVKFDAQFTLSVSDAQTYISPDGRILLQMANQQTALGTTIFSQPTVQLDATFAQ
ncbi:DUF7408 domain-containing protein [Tengunoibacter tsumagoiensis]|uniref:Uncharacterized protein n=1 Tax=Tengunoibacter tsumagoiensis TaxID=2014871 RepID=A0A402A317_9CHLR|nr:hypothetical protein [Tengunoibacter tsumagoiensis]GCE13401.1 hypothetical protein KTT_32600 [Tengunoibacter tsumagoiensis]